MTFLLERDRAHARSRFETARKSVESSQRSYDEAIAAADKAFDRWEARPNDEDAKVTALAKGDKQNLVCRTHIGAVGAFTDAQRGLAILEDPQELERRVRVAETHESWWKSRR